VGECKLRSKPDARLTSRSGFGPMPTRSLAHAASAIVPRAGRRRATLWQNNFGAPKVVSLIAGPRTCLQDSVITRPDHNVLITSSFQQRAENRPWRGAVARPEIPNAEELITASACHPLEHLSSLPLRRTAWQCWFATSACGRRGRVGAHPLIVPFSKRSSLREPAGRSNAACAYLWRTVSIWFPDKDGPKRAL
jgi:hypothetical protein